MHLQYTSYSRISKEMLLLGCSNDEHLQGWYGEELTKTSSKCAWHTQSELHTFSPLQYYSAKEDIVEYQRRCCCPAVRTMNAFKHGTVALPGSLASQTHSTRGERVWYTLHHGFVLLMQQKWVAHYKGCEKCYVNCVYHTCTYVRSTPHRPVTWCTM